MLTYIVFHFAVFQVRSLLFVRLTTAADHLLNTPVYANTCWFILVSGKHTGLSHYYDLQLRT